MELWCSDCKVTIVCSEPSLPTSRSLPIDLPLPLERSRTNLSSVFERDSPPPSLPSSDPRLWRQRVSRWGDSLEASVALLPLSLLHLRMTTFGQARRFTAPSYGDVEDQRQVPPWRSRQPSRPGCLSCSPPPLAIRHLDYLGRLMWSLVVGCLGWGLMSGGVHPRGCVASCPEPCVLCASTWVVCVGVYLCVWCLFLFWGICSPFSYAYTMIRSSPACLRKKTNNIEFLLCSSTGFNSTWETQHKLIIIYNHKSSKKSEK
jgi:hypothetical protein